MKTKKASEFWRKYGFLMIETGGNCTAYAQTDPSNGNEYLITDGEAEAPKRTDQPHTVTVTDAEGNQITQFQTDNAEAARVLIGMAMTKPTR